MLNPHNISFCSHEFSKKRHPRGIQRRDGRSTLRRRRKSLQHRGIQTLYFFTLLLLCSAGTALDAPAFASSPSKAASKLPAASSVGPPKLLQTVLPSAREEELRTLGVKLDVPYALMARGMQGLNLLYNRGYREAEELFSELESAYPDSAVGPFGLALLAQAKMSEDQNFSEESAYEVAYEKVIDRTKREISSDKAKAWNYFLRGSAYGVQSIYYYRKDKVVLAVRDGWRAISDLEESRALEPTFTDPNMGLGLYEYWRTAVTRRYDHLPSYPDKRADGIAQMEAARESGVFTPVLARLALAYTYINYRKATKALEIAEELQIAYPDNLINLQLLGILYIRHRKIDLARASFERVLEIEPETADAYYRLGYIELKKTGDLKKAKHYYEEFLKRESSEYHETMAHVRLGDTLWLLGQKLPAEEEWKLAAKANPDLPIVKMRMEGRRPHLKRARHKKGQRNTRRVYKRGSKRGEAGSPAPRPHGVKPPPHRVRRPRAVGADGPPPPARTDTAAESQDTAANSDTKQPSSTGTPAARKETAASSGAETNADSGTETKTSSGAEASTSSGAETNADSGTETKTSSGAEASTSSGAEANTSSGAEANTSSGAEASTSSGAGTNAGSGTERSSSSGTETKASSEATDMATGESGK